MSIRKAIGKIHLWLGLVSGVIVFIVSITGAIYVFEKEIKNLIYHERLFVHVPADAKRVSLHVLRAKADAMINGEAPLRAIDIPAAPDQSVKFYYEKRDHSRFWYTNSQQVVKHVYFNPYTAELLDVANTKWEFLEVVEWMHFSLLLGYNFGHQVVGWSVLIFVIMLITGIVLWWPKNRKAARQRFWFRWKETTRWKRKNYDLHNILGFYVMAVALVIAITGLVWSFQWVNEGIQWLANGGEASPPMPMVESNPLLQQSDHPLDKIYAAVSDKHPDAYFYSIYVKSTLAEKGVYGVFVPLLQGRNWKSVSYAFDQYSVEQLSKIAHADKSNGQKLRSMNYDIHTGRILGLPGKILAFLASLICASLPVSGFMIWWGRRKKNKRPAKVKPGGNTHRVLDSPVKGPELNVPATKTIKSTPIVGFIDSTIKRWF